jgi:hypothetical protein
VPCRADEVINSKTEDLVARVKEITGANPTSSLLFDPLDFLPLKGITAAPSPADALGSEGRGRKGNEIVRPPQLGCGAIIILYTPFILLL